MIAKFVYISDVKDGQMSKKQGVQAYHRDWASVYNDATAGDSLANTVRHWNNECVVNPGFIFIGGRESIQAVLDHDPDVRLVNPFDSSGVAATFCRAKEGMFQKTYTIVLVLPLSYAPQDAARVNTLGDISAHLGRLDKNDYPAETLAEFRKYFGRILAMNTKYGDF